MTTPQKHPKVDAFFAKDRKWKKELEMMRKIALSCGLTEELKWGKPCYSFEGSNLVILIGFKEYCALAFFKGALLKDPRNLLERPGEHTQAGRQLRFTDAAEIKKMEPILKEYIQEAIQAEKAGLKVPLKKTADHPRPEELDRIMAADRALKKAFEALTPGRQRAYLIYFSGAKQAATRVARIEKYRQQILNGKGMLDR